MQDALVRIRGVTHSYRIGDQVNRVLQDIDLDISSGERLTLLGRSDSGKSTLLNLISGIDRVVEGRVEFDSIDLTGLSEHQRTLFRRRHIGFVYQSFNLISTLTVTENVAMVLELNGFDRRSVKEKTSTMLAAVGLFDKGNRFPD